MKASTELHELIHALSMNEKRHFSLLSSLHDREGGNRYRSLFASISSQEIYDESMLKSGLDQAGKLRFASEKNYLHQLVNDTLLHFHRKRPTVDIYNRLNLIDVLYGKKMFRSCLKIARKGKAETLKLEKLFPALSFIRWEAALLTVIGEMEELDRVIEEERKTLNRATVQAEIMQVAFRIRVLMDSGRFTTKKLMDFDVQLKKAMSKAEKAGDVTFLSHYYYHSAMAMSAAFLQDHARRKDSYRLVYDYMKDREWFIHDVPHIYHNNLNNLVNACIFLGEYDEALNWIKEQRTFMHRYGMENEAMSARIFLTTYENEIFICSKRQDFRRGAELVKSIEQGVKKFGSFYEGEQYELFLALSIYLFTGNELRSSLKWLSRITGIRGNIKPRPEVEVNSRLLQLLIFAEQRDKAFVAARRSLERWVERNQVFLSSLVLLKAIRVVYDHSDSSPLLKDVDFLLKEFEMAQKDPNEKILTKYYDFPAWIRGKCERQ